MTKTPEQLAEEFAEHFAGERRKTIAKKSWWTGYQAAKDEYKVAIDIYNDVAKQMLEEAVRIMSPKDQFADDVEIIAKRKIISLAEAKELFPHGMDQLADADKVMPQWISVKDRLPETNELCIVNTEWRAIVPALYGNESWIFDEGQGWSEKALSYVSHWMPLPKPPEAKE